MLQQIWVRGRSGSYISAVQTAKRAFRDHRADPGPEILCTLDSCAVQWIFAWEYLSRFVDGEALVKCSQYTEVIREVAHKEGTEKYAFCYFHFLCSDGLMVFVHNSHDINLKHLMWGRSKNEPSNQKEELLITNAFFPNFASEAVFHQQGAGRSLLEEAGRFPLTPIHDYNSKKKRND